MFEILFSFSLAVFLVAAIISLLGFKSSYGKLARRVSLVCAAAASVAMLLFAAEILLTDGSYSVLAYQITSTLQFNFMIDRLAAFFLLIVSIVSVSVSIYSIQYVEHEEHEGRKTIRRMGCVG